MAIIKVKNLVKTYKIIEKEDGLIGYFKNLIKSKYKEFTAVNHINFEIQEGELVGYIGENGAGKSTTIKMLTGLLTPTSGEVVVDELVPNKNRIENNKKIGAVFGQKTQLWWDLPVIESFRLIKKMYKIPDGEYRKNLKKFSEILELDDLLEKQVIAQMLVKNKTSLITTETINDEFEVVEESDEQVKIRFNHDKYKLMYIVNRI